MPRRIGVLRSATAARYDTARSNAIREPSHTMAHSASTDGVAQRRDGHCIVEAWLWFVAALIFAMIIVGGATRLTDSGLSITEWQPLLGAIPPLSEADWMIAFEKYRQIPEYHLVNKGMSLEDFQFIYWWEWAHRFLGRVIGVVFAVPLLAFWATGRMPSARLKVFGAVFALGALQGFFGWYMVRSGLSERVDVSQYRLALHLTTAFAIFALIIWLAREERVARLGRLAAITGESADSGVRRWAAVIVGIILVQVVLGAFVAGLKAGLIYNTWPTMDGHWFPPDYWTVPAWLSPFESHAAAQFNHRLVAYVLVAVVAWHLWRVNEAPVDKAIRASAWALGGVVFAQLLVGIWTVIHGVPLSLGLIHQGGGALVLAAAVWHLHATWRAGIAPRD